MPHQFLLHLHRRSGLVQPRTERVPTNLCELPSYDFACVVNEHPLAVRRGLTLPALYARCRTAPRTRDHAASRRAKMPLLDLGWVVRSVRHRIGRHPPSFGGYGLLAPGQNGLGQRRAQRNVVSGIFSLDVSPGILSCDRFVAKLDRFSSLSRLDRALGSCGERLLK